MRHTRSTPYAGCHNNNRLDKRKVNVDRVLTQGRLGDKMLSE